MVMGEPAMNEPSIPLRTVLKNCKLPDGRLLIPSEVTPLVTSELERLYGLETAVSRLYASLQAVGIHSDLLTAVADYCNLHQEANKGSNGKQTND